MSRRIRGWQAGKHPALIDEATFTAARAAVASRPSATKTRRAASVYSVSGLLRCSCCGERMQAVRPPSGRVRYHCRGKAEGIGCTGGGSFLDIDEEQLVGDLTSFALTAEW
jgi:Recombinase zinc beta ribbon domain